ncbi:MAG: hypothetical protein GTN59_12005 [Candidatus Dadabacteria bacterium]|nr:hypothetical protein [Candidatus Dadabacteria bacterium]
MATKRLMFNERTNEVRLTGMKEGSKSGKYEVMLKDGFKPLAEINGMNVTAAGIQPIKPNSERTTEDILSDALNLLITLESISNPSDEVKKDIDKLFNEIKYRDYLDEEMGD